MKPSPVPGDLIIAHAQNVYAKTQPNRSDDDDQWFCASGPFLFITIVKNDYGCHVLLLSNDGVLCWVYPSWIYFDDASNAYICA